MEEKTVSDSGDNNIKRTCLLRNNAYTLYLVEENGVFIRIENEDKGKIIPLPESIIQKQRQQQDISNDIKEYAHKLKRDIYCKKLNYQIENLIFLTGSGTSYKFGNEGKQGELMSGLWDSAIEKLGTKDNLDAFCKKIKYTEMDNGNVYKKNIEKLLSLAERAKEYVDGKVYETGKGDNKKEWKITDIIKLIKEMIKDKCNLHFNNDNDSLTHEAFLNKITKRKGSLPRVKLFTLNYDTLFEQAARKGNYTIIDGFSFSLPRTFSGRYFDYDVVIRDKSRIKNEENFMPRVFHLYKPHGSVDWKRVGDMIIQEDADKIDVMESMLIFPEEDKYEHSYEQPFFEMMSRFQSALRLQNTTLITIGFSFGDKHILSMICEAIEQN
ncbi:MAG: SIR2 family protein, partial [Prevotella sp.]|nr:SIR2 family protein [Prevotella sp.]